MTRRFADLRHPRPSPIGAGGWIVISTWSMVAVLLIWAVAVLTAPYAKAWDGPQSDPAVGAWYRSLMQPDNPKLSCCGESDAYWADEIVVEGDKVFAIITDTRDDAPLRRPHIKPGTRFEIPKSKYKFDAGNPTGHHVIFVNSIREVLCFVQGSGT